MRNRYRVSLCHQALLFLNVSFFSHFSREKFAGHLIDMDWLRWRCPCWKKRKVRLKHWSLLSTYPFIFYKKKLQNLRRKLVDKGGGRVEVTITVWWCPWCPPWDWRKVTQSDTERPHFFIHSPLIVGSDITNIRNWRKVIQGRSGAVPRQFHAETVLVLEYIQYIYIHI